MDDGVQLPVFSSLFIHSSDHPGLLLVSKKLNGDNYATWQRSMVIALTAKNKIGFVDGSIERPSSTKKSDDYTLWDRCDKMVLSWLLNSVDSDLADSVVYAATAREIWQDFEDRFSQGNAPRIFQIQKMIVSHTQGTMSMSWVVQRHDGSVSVDEAHGGINGSVSSDEAHEGTATKTACLPQADKATIERYKKACAESTNTGSVSEASTQYYQQEAAKLRSQIGNLQNSSRHMMAESLSFMNMKDLKNLESKLEKGISRVRSRKAGINLSLSTECMYVTC
ncbi:unnamed protein product [Prunus armeniaca]|uniref:K-box domain-containing protein n=1 Tax=Prunus armeniaca TaxID=36596 RepID=A0A6J5WTJ9_PRUAR|nr:unnamed protein product [Prunus armeniaca]